MNIDCDFRKGSVQLTYILILNNCLTYITYVVKLYCLYFYIFL